MRIYWSDGAIPELKGFARKDRGLVLNACRLRAFTQRKTWIFAAYYFPIMGALKYVGRSYGALGMFVVMSVAVPIAIRLFMTLVVTDNRPFMKYYVDEHLEHERAGRRPRFAIWPAYAANWTRRERLSFFGIVGVLYATVAVRLVMAAMRGELFL